MDSVNAVRLTLKSRNPPETHWELVLDTVLHSIRSLLCTATNQTPHERLFPYPRKSQLSFPGPILLRKFLRTSKSDPLVEPVNLVSATPYYAHGMESTVSSRDLAPSPRNQVPYNEAQPLTPSRTTSETPTL
ncbi:hypothetical protein Pmani_018435 [Petrolisthes manimaculis]|uniref:Uncharacterized protein n=1 Tax=Petrolisthes manimaculis TaxID=1843537 RepID=A0AAE1PL09_9EUCA|nr:hypothetical protein Pmani_018435 [Petrolisthes manimaculis]